MCYKCIQQSDYKYFQFIVYLHEIVTFITHVHVIGFHNDADVHFV